MSATPAPAHILAARISFARGESLVTRRDQRGCPAPLERAFRACIRGTVGALMFCAILIALSPTNAQALSKPPFPVIFIHGLQGSIQTWETLRDFLIQGGWTFGGFPSFNSATGEFLTGASRGDFYTMQFSDPCNLGFEQQGEELDHIVQAVLGANAGTTKVILVGHSMGGLAARAYVQPPRYHDDNVARLVTVGTPHQGADFTSFANALSLLGLICPLTPLPEALRELDPQSTALAFLNNLSARPLPNTVSYVSIVVSERITDPLGVIHDLNSDGVVSTNSQDLSNVNGFSALNLSHTSVPIPVSPRSACTTIGDAHSCETSDQGVWLEILHDISSTPGTGVPSTLINLSTRSQVQTGANVLIGGFVIGGETAKTVLIRALGPTLGLPPFNVPGALPNPVVTLFAGATALASNDDWQNQSDPTCATAGLLCGTPTDIAATSLAPPQPLEAALLITLAPGAYTAIVSGAGGLTGVGLVEVYEAGGP